MELALAPPGLCCAPLSWDDAAALQALLDACAPYFASAESRAVSKREGLERISEALGDEDQALLGVSPLGERALLGLMDVRAHVPAPDSATIALLLIAPTARRRGHAAALVSELVSATQVAGFDSLHLGVRRGGDAAHAFWEAQGFVDVGREDEVTRYLRRLA